MKYYAICRKLLEDDEFEKLISDLVKKISKKFTEEISLETLVKILEINVSTILIIAIIDIVKVEKEKIIVPETEKFLVEKDGIRLPLLLLSGFGEVDANKLVEARKEEKFT